MGVGACHAKTVSFGMLGRASARPDELTLTHTEGASFSALFGQLDPGVTDVWPFVFGNIHTRGETPKRMKHGEDVGTNPLLRFHDLECLTPIQLAFDLPTCHMLASEASL